MHGPRAKARPNDDGKQTCLVCLRQERRGRGREQLPNKCGGCGFPVCSAACGERHGATAECAVIARHVPADDRGMVNLDAILPLRSENKPKSNIHALWFIRDRL